MHLAMRFRRGLSAALLLALAVLCVGPQASAAEPPFSQPTNRGGTGLMQIPNARVIGDGIARAGASDMDPFYTFYGTLGFFPGLELNGRLTEFKNVPAGFSGGNYGKNKDKAADVKYQIFDESKYFPALAVGLEDPSGTQLFKAEYVVMDRQIYPFNFTLGYGWDGLDGLFGGIACQLTDRIQLTAEYNPINIKKDNATVQQAYGSKEPGKINLGARLRLFRGGEVTVTYQEGNQFGAMASLSFPLGENLVPWKPDPPYYAPVDRRPLQERDGTQIVDTIRERLEEQGFFNVSVYLRPQEIAVQYENARYFSQVKALGRVLRTVVALCPANVERITLYAKSRNLPLLKFSVKNEVALEYLNGRIDEEMLAQVVEVSTSGFASDPAAWEFQAGLRPLSQRLKTSYGVDPGFEAFLNDPTNFFHYRISVDPWAEAVWWDGFAAYGKLLIPLYSNVKTSNPPLHPPVRTDVVDYMQDEATFVRLVADQVFRLGDRTFARASVGYQELMYAGVGGEILYVIGDGRLSAGFSADWDRKREPGFSLGFRDFDTHTLLGNLYYNVIPDLGVTAHLYGGRFMAGDKGVGGRLSREFKTGATVSFWYTYTDTSDFTGDNHNYQDKGVALILPARMFFQQDTNEEYRYAISPWTRDVGQLVNYWNTLAGFVRGLNPSQITTNLKELKE
jgi:hypothetical protein